jgi:hypothetical protein
MTGKQMQRNKRNKQSRRRRGADNVGPVPSVYKAKLTYVDSQSISAVAGSLASYGYRANGMYDPNYTGVGTQPLYYDQLGAMYSKTRVTSAKITVELHNVTGVPVTFVCFPSMQNSTGAAIEVAQEQRYAKYGLLGISGSPGCHRKLTFRLDIAKIWGITESGLRSEDDFTALIGGTPNNVVYFWIAVKCVDNATATGAFFTVSVVYESEYHMPLFVTGS